MLDAPMNDAQKLALQKQFSLLSCLEHIKDFIDLSDDFFMVLNEDRRIVYCNEALMRVADRKRIEDIVGLRPGEALNCSHCSSSACGATKFCRYCGASNAILKSQGGTSAHEECRLSMANGQSSVFMVSTRPFALEDCSFIILHARDISDEKRRRMLESIFFHDVLNTAGVLLSIIPALKKTQGSKAFDLLTLAENAAQTLVDDISSQKDIQAAENGDLKPNIESLESLSLLEALRSFYSKHELAFEKDILIDQRSSNIVFESDRRILQRILGNMLKNALEASNSGEAVTLRCFENDGKVFFEVNNKAFIPYDVQMQIFSRSFSTKGKNRGLGTYSVKILSENYLNGKVSFSSSEEEGTTLSVTYPLKYNNTH
jgi:hypothetical protein